MSVEMLNGQLGKLPLNRDDDPAAHGGPEGSDETPWRQEMLPPGQPDAFGTQRQIPSDGDLHIAQDASGYRMYPKGITPEHDGRQLPYEGDVAFDRMRLPTASYRTRAEAFKNVPYWSVKPVMGPEDWPSRKLFPSQPNVEVVDGIEHDIMPLPYTRDNHRGYSVMDIPGVDFDPDLEIGLSGLGNLGLIAPATMVSIATKAVTDTAAANPTAAAQPGWLASAISGAAGLAAQYMQLQTVKTAAKTAAMIPGTQIPIPAGVERRNGTYYAVTEEPFYTKPGFLVLAALGLVGGGYLLLKK